MIYHKHRVLLRQGDEGRHLLLLTRGVVKITASTESGTDTLLGIRVAGDVVGEMAAFEDRPRSGTVLACGEVAARIESDPILHRTPVVFLTALVTRAEARSGLEIQGHPFLAKPISIPDLVAGIERYLPAHTAC